MRLRKGILVCIVLFFMFWLVQQLYVLQAIEASHSKVPTRRSQPPNPTVSIVQKQQPQQPQQQQQQQQPQQQQLDPRYHLYIAEIKPLPVAFSATTDDTLQREYSGVEWNARSYGGGFDSIDDARYSVRATVVVVALKPRFPFMHLRNTIAALHYWEWGRRIVVYASGYSDDEFAEASLFYHTLLYELPLDRVEQMATSNAMALGLAASDADALEWMSNQAQWHANAMFGASKCRMVPYRDPYASAAAAPTTTVPPSSISQPTSNVHQTPITSITHLLQLDFKQMPKRAYEPRYTVTATVPSTNETLPWDIGECVNGGSIGIIMHPRNLTLIRPLCELDLEIKHLSFTALQKLPVKTPAKEYHVVRGRVSISSDCKANTFGQQDFTRCFADMRFFQNINLERKIANTEVVCASHQRGC
jgi:hypothetical protein